MNLELNQREAKPPAHGKPSPPSEPHPQAMMSHPLLNGQTQMMKEVRKLIDDSIMKLHSLREKLFFYMGKPPNKIQTLQFQINANLLKARQLLERLEHGRISESPQP